MIAPLLEIHPARSGEVKPCELLPFGDDLLGVSDNELRQRHDRLLAQSLLVPGFCTTDARRRSRAPSHYVESVTAKSSARAAMRYKVDVVGDPLGA
jgi:hypothetical protein